MVVLSGALHAASRVALAAALVAALPGCYEPSLRDCSLACSASSDCAGDQVCGEDGLCAAPDVAGHCAAMGSDGIDAGVPKPDAMMPPPPPPPTNVELRVQIMGKGSIIVDNRGVCSSQGSTKGDCTFLVPVGAAQTVRALSIQIGESFQSWTSPTCKDATAICTFTPSAAVTVVARFGK